MRGLFKQLVIFVLVVVFVFGFMTYRTVHWNQPQLPETELSGLTLQTYLYSVKRLPEATQENPVGVSLSPEGTSYLLENIDYNFDYGGFRVTDVHLDNVDGDIQTDFVLKGPLGLYYHGRFQGTVEYTGDGPGWTIQVNQLQVGAFPLGYTFFGPYQPDWPNTFRSGAVTIQELRLDGKGLRLSVNRFEIDLEKALELKP